MEAPVRFEPTHKSFAETSRNHLGRVPLGHCSMFPEASQWLLYMEPSGRFELPTNWFEASDSGPLSYEGMVRTERLELSTYRLATCYSIR
jgi:hypothetical protein